MNTCAICNKPITKKETKTCSMCGAILCFSHAYLKYLKYVDGNNETITCNAPIVCEKCSQIGSRDKNEISIS
jgi:hypothetical protein